MKTETVKSKYESDALGFREIKLYLFKVNFNGFNSYTREYTKLNMQKFCFT